MAIQFSTAVRNAQLDAVETAIGTAPTLELRTGAPPATCATASSGTLIVSSVLPSDWLAAASSGAKAITGTWPTTAAGAAGTVAHYRILVGGTCHMQGTVTATGGGGDMILTSTTFAVSDTATVSTFTLTAGNA